MTADLKNLTPEERRRNLARAWHDSGGSIKWSDMATRYGVANSTITTDRRSEEFAEELQNIRKGEHKTRLQKVWQLHDAVVDEALATIEERRDYSGYEADQIRAIEFGDGARIERGLRSIHWYAANRKDINWDFDDEEKLDVKSKLEKITATIADYEPMPESELNGVAEDAQEN